MFLSTQELAEETGREMRALYYSDVGESDGIAIVDFPSGEAVEQFRLAFEREGTHHFESYEVFDAGNYSERIEEATR